jgi:hypothetical protein
MRETEHVVVASVVTVELNVSYTIIYREEITTR